MKLYILVDENNIVRCMASEEANLHPDKLYMDKYHVERKGTVGDEYNPVTEIWTPRPENYPQPSQDDIDEAKISAEIKLIAIQSLKDKGELPTDYET